MKQLLFGFFLALSFTGIAQNSACNFNMDCKISAPSGMRMRAAPNLKAAVVTYVPFDSSLVACTEIFGKMTYEQIEGNWRKVDYNGKQGFMFDGFMEILAINIPPSPFDTTNTDSTKSTLTSTLVTVQKIAPNTNATEFSLMTETYNYCGDVSKLDPGLLWYGFYPKEENNPNAQNYRVKQVEVDVSLSKQKVGDGVEFDVTTEDTERSIFLIGLNRQLQYTDLQIKDQSDRLRMSGRKVFPGQQVVLLEGKNRMTLSATGSVESTGPCPTLKEYKLTLSGQKYFLEVKQDMIKALGGSGACGMPEIYWFGDFTGDDVPEIIFVSVYEEKNHFTLFISNPNKDDILLEKSAEWTIDKCY